MVYGSRNCSRDGVSRHGMAGTAGARERRKHFQTYQKHELKPTDDIADIGAGSGYHVLKMARLVNDGQFTRLIYSPKC